MSEIEQARILRTFFAVGTHDNPQVEKVQVGRGRLGRPSIYLHLQAGARLDVPSQLLGIDIIQIPSGMVVSQLSETKNLIAHLMSVHGGGFSGDLHLVSDEEVAQWHLDEHRGSGGIRSHEEDDLSWNKDSVVTVVHDMWQMNGRDGTIEQVRKYVEGFLAS